MSVVPEMSARLPAIDISRASTARASATTSATRTERAVRRTRGTAWLSVVLEAGRGAAISLVFFTLYRLSSAWSSWNGARTDAAQGRILRNYLVAMGPMYVKLGQVLATRSDLLPEAWIEQLSKLQDQGPCMSPAQTQRMLTRNFGQWSTVFAEFDMVPVASASIAQVHRARLPTGEEVAVKLVKRGVRAAMSRNTEMLEAFCTVLHRCRPSIRHLNLPPRVAEICALLRVQTGLRQEAEAQQQIWRNFEGHPFVRVPKVFVHQSSDDVLVMEYIHAVPGHSVRDVQFPRAEIARRLQDTIYTMLYMHGLCHGDPHPGNLMFTDIGEIILLDCGITAALTEDEKWGLSSFYYAAMRKEWDLAVERFTKHFVTEKGNALEQWTVFRDELRAVFVRHLETNANRWSTITYFQDVNAVLRKYGARYTAAFTKVELVFLSCEGFASQIDPDINIWENARRFVDRYSPYMNEGIRTQFDLHFSRAIPTSLKLRDEADRRLVAPTHMHRYFFPSTYPLFVRSAIGGTVTDMDGNTYVDLSGGYGPHFLGYKHPAITSALADAIAAGFVNAIGNVGEVELARLIVEALPAADKAVLCNSGTEAVLIAIRLCRAYTKRQVVVKFEGHYHGFSDQGMVSSWFRFRGDKYAPKPVAGSQGVDASVIASTLVLQHGHVPGLRTLREHAAEIACVICEPMSAATAMVDKGFLEALRAECDILKVPLIFDEVVTGFRVAYGGVQNQIGVVPDLTCLGKVIGGGLPCGAVAGNAAIIDSCRSTEDPFLDYDTKAFAGGTMSGNSLTCAAGTAALQYLGDHKEIYSEVANKTGWLAHELRAAAAATGVACKVAANNSIFSLTFAFGERRLYREKVAGSNFKATIALAYYMRKHNVYLPELHSFLLSAAHTDEDLQVVRSAFAVSLAEMEQDGLFGC